MAHAAIVKPTITLNRILFATDFSENSARAIPHVARIAKQFGATVFPVHVIPSEPRYEVPLDPLREDLSATRKAAEDRMQRFLDNDALRDVSKQIYIERGNIIETLRDIMDQSHIDLVVVGTHGHAGVSKLLFGSVAEEVFRRTSCPVLVVGPHVTDDSRAQQAIRRILFATDLSNGSMAVLPFAIDIANAFGAFFKIVHVVQDSRDAVFKFMPEMITKREQFLEKTLAHFQFVHEAEIIVEAGTTGDALLKVADTHEIDLLIMGARKVITPALLSHIPASITHFVASHARCPVLVLRVSE
jgi:nucleotide-binding universal stress UspA family protein